MRLVLALAILCASIVAALPNQTPAIDAVEDISARATDVDIDQTPAFDTLSAASEPPLPLDDFTAVELEERASYEASVELEARTLDKRAPKTPKTVVIDGARLLSARTKLKNGSASAAVKRR